MAGSGAFDPRRQLYSVLPQVLAGALSLAALGLGWRLSADEVARKDPAGAAAFSGLGLDQARSAQPTVAPPETSPADIKLYEDTAVAQGPLRGSFLESAIAAGAEPEVIIQAVKLFSHTLDFGRDIHPGDEFRLVYDRKVTDAGRPVDTGDLLYAEIGAEGRVARFYRFQPPSGDVAFFDERGRAVKGLLLRTPVDGARVTSGFGMRLHPLLGYTRMHQGIDFAAPVGTPVYAAGDGVVEEAGWNGGYGRWVKLRHNGVWETGYGHLSGWVVHPGERVVQGQVIAYSGSSGESTGPHLHYEVIKDGEKIDPKSANASGGGVLAGRDLVAFKIEKARIDAVLAGYPAPRIALADAAGGVFRLRAAESLAR
ncbi:MAG: M23 family metallopeptidase [Caulobacteraceae bacterium]|nr:M23 family metallopeptidase [Caulobacteraceae bacterium]